MYDGHFMLFHLLILFWLLAVLGNAGGEIDKRVMKDLVSLRTFHMEYDICSVSWFTCY